MRLRRVLAASAVVVLGACSGDSGDVATSTTRPSPSTTAPPTTTVPPVVYEVRAGDTLAAIAEFFGLSPTLLAEANQLPNPDHLPVGQVLTIPPIPPAQVTVMPNVAPAGETFTFTVTGAQAGERVTFEVVAPDESTFAGPPHTASEDGGATARYDSSGDAPGLYTVVATGDRGTSVQARYLVSA